MQTKKEQRFATALILIAIAVGFYAGSTGFGYKPAIGQQQQATMPTWQYKPPTQPTAMPTRQYALKLQPPTSCTTNPDCSPRGPSFICNTSNQCEWKPPIGIPKPEFGIEETYRMYDEPAARNPDLNYHENAEGGRYTHYVDNTNPNATDSDNPYGTASKPRETIPGEVPAGTVLEVHGGPYTHPGNYGWITANGTKDHPVFMRGINQDNMPLISYTQLRVSGKYAIFEYLDFDNGTFVLHSTSTHEFIAIRHSEIHHLNTTGIYLETGSNNIVIYNNNIHDRGDWDTQVENDHHAVGCWGTGEKVWIVDNHFHHNGGDGMQIGIIRYLYIGRNVIHHHRENGLDNKGGQHIIVSQNTFYGFYREGGWAIRPNDEGPSPENFWIIFNDIYDCGDGVQGGGTNVPPYVIGNKIHDLILGLGNGAVAIEGATECVVNNVIYNVDGGIRTSDVIIANNIISNASEYHIWADGEIRNSLLWQNGDPVSIRGTGTCIDCNYDDPKFVDAAAGDFHLEPDSPAIDNGIESNVYQTFFNLYGIDISVDFDGNPIPADGDGDGIAEWNIGAFEAEEPVGCITTELLLDYIDQWKQGSLTMPSLIDRIAKWKSGEGC